MRVKVPLETKKLDGIASTKLSCTLYICKRGIYIPTPADPSNTWCPLIETQRVSTRLVPGYKAAVF